MASAKTARSRGTPVKENGVKLEEGLILFKSDKFDPDSYVQSKCSLNDKVHLNLISNPPFLCKIIGFCSILVVLISFGSSTEFAWWELDLLCFDVLMLMFSLNALSTIRSISISCLILHFCFKSLNSVTDCWYFSCFSWFWFFYWIRLMRVRFTLFWCDYDAVCRRLGSYVPTSWIWKRLLLRKCGRVFMLIIPLSFGECFF